jgi:hypothetical protein
MHLGLFDYRLKGAQTLELSLKSAGGVPVQDAEPEAAR